MKSGIHCLIILLFIVIGAKTIWSQEASKDSSSFSLYIGYSNFEFGKNKGTSQYGDDDHGALPLDGGFAPSIGAEWSFYPQKKIMISLGTSMMWVYHKQRFQHKEDYNKKYTHNYAYSSTFIMGLYPLLTNPDFRIQTGIGLFYDEILYSKTRSEFGDENDYRVEGGGSHLDWVTRFNISVGKSIKLSPYFSYNLLSNCKIRHQDQVIINFPDGLRFGINTYINLK